MCSSSDSMTRYFYVSEKTCIIRRCKEEFKKKKFRSCQRNLANSSHHDPHKHRSRNHKMRLSSFSVKQQENISPRFSHHQPSRVCRNQVLHIGPLIQPKRFWLLIRLKTPCLTHPVFIFSTLGKFGLVTH